MSFDDDREEIAEERRQEGRGVRGSDSLGIVLKLFNMIKYLRINRRIYGYKTIPS